MGTDAAYWQTSDQDAAMQEEHGFMWRAMLDTVDADVSGARVLDSGCNRGGFLRLLCDERAIGVGYGYDPAAGAVDDARRLAGDRPLSFEVADTVPTGWDGFEAAVARLKMGFVPFSPHARSFPSSLEYFYDHKVMLRFAKPVAPPR